MLERRLSFAFELGNDALGEGLAKLHAPLVEGVDLPDGSLVPGAVKKMNTCPLMACLPDLDSTSTT